MRIYTVKLTRPRGRAWRIDVVARSRKHALDIMQRRLRGSVTWKTMEVVWPR